MISRIVYIGKIVVIMALIIGVFLGIAGTSNFFSWVSAETSLIGPYKSGDIVMLTILSEDAAGGTIKDEVSWQIHSLEGPNVVVLDPDGDAFACPAQVLLSEEIEASNLENCRSTTAVPSSGEIMNATLRHLFK